jgi:hypothetical protein
MVYDPLEGLAKFDVVWDSPSRDAWGTMPVGNGDIGLNVWVDEAGDLLFYIGKTDAWDDNGRLLKIGRVRIRLTPGSFVRPASFRQRLSLRDATIEIASRGGPGEAVTAMIWVDAHHPVVHVRLDATVPVEAVASVELWRNEPTELPSIEVSDVHYDHDVPDHRHFPTIVEPDAVLRDRPDRIGWYHHNAKSVGPALSARLQDMEGFVQADPILGRTFGAMIIADNGRRVDDLQLASPAGRAHHFRIYVRTAHPASPAAWAEALEQEIVAVERTPLAGRRDDHCGWWEDFWRRSWIDIAAAGADDERFVLSRAYALQRFVNACGGRGLFPIKFNGSIFTVPSPGRPGDADYRLWGPGYWWQNTRLPYLSMCASGDFDLLASLYGMYAGEALEMAKYRTGHYFGHAGAYFNECMYFWGAAFNESYGWTPREARAVVENESRWHRWEWQGGIELVFMMLDHFEHTLDGEFLRKKLLPLAHEILIFYDLHYPVDENGKIVMDPAQALETWWDCRNPTPEIAGILSVTERLEALAGGEVAVEERGLWRRLHDKMPALPTRELGGTRMLAPAEAFANKNNSENPELYAVFPYRRIAVGRPDLMLAKEALRHRWDKGNFGWCQDEVFMACLGEMEQAKENILGRAANKHEGSRFPAFWGPNFDWIPDQDHGGVLLKALQAMLVQSDGKKIFLLPAWPAEWDVDFKLHAPYRTVLEGRIRGGRVIDLRIDPPGRRDDVVILGAAAAGVSDA